MASTKSQLFDVEHQLTFYGAYHHNSVNVAIHMICVPLLLWTFSAMATTLPTPSWFPSIHQQFGPYLLFELNWASVHAILYWLYYLALEPVATLLYTPQLALQTLSAIAYVKSGPDHLKQAALLHGVSWIAQFIGHGAAEKRAPALLDNLLGAVVLAPFFVHLEYLFKLGYRRDLQKKLDQQVEAELARIKGQEKDVGKKQL
ncbi:DUF962-domain-containing protein [Neolentinus lepideus HHB14362 ss-1]|uniref:DUF962-domain-containing protein n=1 Tax=Neolentinus lepideus HHB14362 ss-1 TaxID=1314782 RepID=A0A165TQ82_9AGAM|nr:DUF962-domain-containing protein [Neolentinus lepideus HHB14362 ss-1]